jgi:prepilin-type N-terminal cleavage/methylation domain-containing protein
MINMYVKKQNTKGFTIVELLIVIAIIGILAAVTLSSLNASRLKADDAKRAQDMAQVKTALELYAEKNSYNLPVLAYAQPGENVKESKVFSFLATPVYADGHTEPACVKFDQLAQILVNAGYMPQIPKDPRDAPTDSCYKAYSIDTDGDTSTAEAITGYALLWEKYETATNGVYGNKKVGFISSGKTEVNGSLMSQVCTITGEYPIFDLSSTSNLCTRNPSDVVADRVLGITNGVEYSSGVVTPSDIPSDTPSDIPSDIPSDTPSTGSGYCSNSSYTNQADCEQDRSYCSNNAYTDQASCESHGETTSSYCSNSNYTDQYSCESNGSYSGGSCSGGGSYTDESSCLSAGYYSPEPSCSNSSYTDEYSCVNATVETSPGYCSGSGYYDESSCTSATCGGTSAYCSDYTSYDQYTCESNGATWYPEQSTSCGYYWNPATYGNAGYSWNNGVFYSYNYVWYPGTYTANTWYQGTFTPYTWTSVPGSTWYSY